MTWFASGRAFGLLGTVLDEEGISDAFNMLFRDIDVLLADDVTIPAVENAIQRWSGADMSATPFLSRADDPNRASRLHLDIAGEGATADPTFGAFVVRPGAEEVTLTFVDDGQLSVNTFLTDGGPPARLVLGSQEDSYVFVDAFVGNGTTRQTAIAKVTAGVAHVRLRLRGRIAVLIGTRIRVAAESSAARDLDPFWRDRLGKFEADPKHEALAAKHVQICDAPPGPVPIAVLVHGTFSSCVPMLADVSGALGKVPLYRFEHDTMRPVAENARELATSLRRIGSTNVTLIGHSRGGLVATWVAAGLPTVTKVLTFGTPHRGTPVVSSLDNLLGYAATSAGIQLKSILDGGLTAAHWGSTLPNGHLPSGWSDMLPHGSFIQTLPFINRRAVTAYGGIFNGSKPELGTGPNFNSQVMTQLMMGDNDLVVPIESSKPDELPGVILDQVDHFSYFKNPQAQKAMEEALHPSPSHRSVSPF